MIKTKYWELLYELAGREIKARYKQSFLGFFWIILNPFFQMLILSFVFSTIVKFPGLTVPYSIYLFAGLLPWFFLANSTSSATGVLIENGSLIKKIYFPRQILVLSTLLAKLFDFLLASLVFIGLMFWFRLEFNSYMLLFFPIFLIQFIFVYALSLLISVLNLFYRDIQYLFTLVITLWFYLTPVIYPAELFPLKHRWIFKLNPMAVFINAYRQVLFNKSMPNLSSLGIGLIISIGFFIVASVLFKKMEKVMADVV